MPLRIVGRCLPLPGQLPIGGSVDGVLALVAPAATPVHAIVAGVITRSSDPDVVLRADDGLTITYSGLSPRSITVRNCARVRAGIILGLVGLATRPAQRDGSRPGLRLRGVDAQGVAVDWSELLVGLVDPNEFGQAPVGTGTDIDPFELDGQLVASAAVPTWPHGAEGSGP
jgi:murein DD-endopeptidase MepM/ murein hydrolase activator NlpD